MRRRFGQMGSTRGLTLLFFSLSFCIWDDDGKQFCFFNIESWILCPVSCCSAKCIWYPAKLLAMKCLVRIACDDAVSMSVCLLPKITLTPFLQGWCWCWMDRQCVVAFGVFWMRKIVRWISGFMMNYTASQGVVYILLFSSWCDESSASSLQFITNWGFVHDQLFVHNQLFITN